MEVSNNNSNKIEHANVSNESCTRNTHHDPHTVANINKDTQRPEQLAILCDNVFSNSSPFARFFKINILGRFRFSLVFAFSFASPLTIYRAEEDVIFDSPCCRRFECFHIFHFQILAGVLRCFHLLSPVTLHLLAKHCTTAFWFWNSITQIPIAYINSCTSTPSECFFPPARWRSLGFNKCLTCFFTLWFSAYSSSQSYFFPFVPRMLFLQLVVTVGFTCCEPYRELQMQWRMSGPELHIASSGCWGTRLGSNPIAIPDAVESFWARTHWQLEFHNIYIYVR